MWFIGFKASLCVCWLQSPSWNVEQHQNDSCVHTYYLHYGYEPAYVCVGACIFTDLLTWDGFKLLHSDVLRGSDDHPTRSGKGFFCRIGDRSMFSVCCSPTSSCPATDSSLEKESILAMDQNLRWRRQMYWPCLPLIYDPVVVTTF